MPTFKRGNIYFIQSSYTEQGVEQRGDRPAVIVSNDKGNEHSECVEIVYMTTQPKAELPTHVLIRSALKPSTLLCEQIITVSKDRVGTWIGTLTEQEIQQMDTAIATSIGLDFAAPLVVREPTKEEVEERAKEMLKHMAPPEPSQPEKVDTDLVKVQTERDLYKKFSEDLMQVLKGGK
jgi:mRNA interferase MazF